MKARLKAAAMAIAAFFILESIALADFSSDSYANVLRTFVNEQGLVAYAALKSNRNDLDTFTTALANMTLQELDVLSREERLAFWINAYNGLTLKVIIDHYPIRPAGVKKFLFPANSIRQIPGVWDEVHFPVAGKSLTLDQIENDLLRGEFSEPRIHFAIVCASKGCAPLRREPFVGATLEQQLEDQVLRVLQDPSRNYFDRDRNLLYLSRIFKWFRQDFAAEGGIHRFLAAREFAGLNEDRLRHTRIIWLAYDWELNEQG